MDFNLPALKLLLPLFVLIAVIEAIWLRRSRGRYDWRQSGASLAIALGQKLSAAAAAALATGLFAFAWQHRWFEIPSTDAWSIALLFLCTEFAYYWHHRASHECRWFWASHAVHHSANEFNLSASYRLGWTAGFTGQSLFYLPLVLLGFSPTAVFAMLALNLAYQFWLHTELVPKLGWFEWLFNTPSHHRVHHASNADYLDRNYGGILIVFDRWFGTYAEERDDAPCRYGLVTPLISANPLRIVFHEWIAIGRDLRRANRWNQRWRYLFGAPGWRADGPGTTAAEIRQRAWALSHQPQETSR